MTLMNLPPSMLYISVCFSFLYFCLNPNKILSNAEIIRDGNNNVKGMFVFGSSYVDNGNNNFLPTLAKADYLPYGMDFESEYFGLPAFIPPFLDPSTNVNHSDVGVNYASGGSGILNSTGTIAGVVLSLNEQIRLFEEVTLPNLKNSSRESLSKYLCVIGSGGNDYTLNYFLNISQSNTSVEEFTAILISTLSSQIKKLYSLGLSKFVLMSLYPLGCSPVSIAAQQPPSNACVQYLNDAAQLFNSNLRTLINDIRPQMPGSNLIIVNAYNIIQDILGFPALKGFTNTTKPCCEVPSRAQGGNGISCKRGGSTCQDRDKFVYFDALHPTEAVNVILAKKAYASILTREVYPFNVWILAQI
ncbi:hypothetical protein DCAR_0622907 [Daucus carota subsp. sativus]|uniref:Uncharacterized protein n=1 Tax=Daucus carota subsp. sativus TaxID=79200 RepID=A0AAF0X931_DAUCS|nr:hypothetical protein DCAR_0622907 [Daucus carota subsp. sativus]